MAEVNTGATIQIARVGAHGLICGPAFGSGSAPGSMWNAAVTALSPVLWYKYLEVNGTTIHDSSGNGLDGLINSGTVPLYAQPPILPSMNPSIQLSTVSNPVSGTTTPDNVLLDITGDFTILCGFNMVGYVAWFQKMFWKVTDAVNGKATYYLGFDLNVGTMRGRVNIGGAYFDVTSPSQVSAGSNYMAALERSGSNLNLWIGLKGDPTITKVATTTGVTGALDTAADPLLVSGQTVDAFNGALSDSLIFASALGNANLQNLWTIANT